MSRVKGSASHCPIEERYPKADGEAEINISAFHGALSAQRELPCGYYMSPLQAPRNCHGVCVSTRSKCKYLLEERIANIGLQVVQSMD